MVETTSGPDTSKLMTGTRIVLPDLLRSWFKLMRRPLLLGVYCAAGHCWVMQ